VTCAEIQAQAAGLASLPPTDAARIAARAHASSCAACTAALAEGETLMRVLDEALPLESLQPEALQRTAQEILSELDRGRPARTRVGAGGLGAIALALSASWLLPLAAGHKLGAGAGVWMSAALAALAAATTAASIALGGLALAAIPLLSLVASALGSTGGPVRLAAGLPCLLFELGLAFPAFAVATVLAFKRLMPEPRSALPAAAGGGALIGQAVLHLNCHALPSHGHLFIFHTGGVLLALALGAVICRSLRFGR
jgi:hypothetical protein